MEAYAVGILIGVAIFAGLGGYVAGQKGRSPAEGLVLGGLFGPLGCLIEACLPAVPSASGPPRRLARGSYRGEWRHAKPESPDEDLAMEALDPRGPTR